MNKKGMEFTISTIAKLVLLMVGLALILLFLTGPNSVNSILEKWTETFISEAKIY